MSTELVIPLVILGGNRGWEWNVGNIENVGNEFSAQFHVIPIDAVPARRLRLQAALAACGHYCELGANVIQEARREGLLDHKPWLYIALDKPRAILEALDVARTLNLGVLCNLFVEFPGWQLLGARFFSGPGDQKNLTAIDGFFSRLVTLTTFTGSNAVFGPASRMENGLVEKPIRGPFFREGIRAVAKASMGQTPEIVPFAVTFTGEGDMPAVITRAAGDKETPKVIAGRILANPPFPILPGTEIVIFQLPPANELILNRARLRRGDHAMRLGRPRPVEATALEDAIRTSDRNTVSPVNPILMTD